MVGLGAAGVGVGTVGAVVGLAEGVGTGTEVGAAIGEVVGDAAGAEVGAAIGEVVGNAAGAEVGVSQPFPLLGSQPPPPPVGAEVGLWFLLVRLLETVGTSPPMEPPPVGAASRGMAPLVFVVETPPMAPVPVAVSPIPPPPDGVAAPSSRRSMPMRPPAAAHAA